MLVSTDDMDRVTEAFITAMKNGGTISHTEVGLTPEQMQEVVAHLETIGFKIERVRVH